MLCLVLVPVCGISISTFAVNTDGRINRAGQESTQIMEESKETSVANEKDLKTEQEKKKTSEDSSESQTKRRMKQRKKNRKIRIIHKTKKILKKQTQRKK